MPTPEAIAAEKERLYESSSLRDDLNDSEATVLLTWGEGQIDRLAQAFPDEFEQKARFMRQVLKHINRFVGQREFNDLDGQKKYMDKIGKYLEAVGWADVSTNTLFAALPKDKADMAANLNAILKVLSPSKAVEDAPTDDAPPTDQVSQVAEAQSAIETSPQEDMSLTSQDEAVLQLDNPAMPLLDDPEAPAVDPLDYYNFDDTNIEQNNEQPLENSNTHSINESENTYYSGEFGDYGED